MVGERRWASARQMAANPDRRPVGRDQKPQTADPVGHPERQSQEHRQPDQPIAAFLKNLSQVQGAFSTAGWLLDPLIDPVVLGCSLRSCEQPATRLKEVDDVRWRDGRDCYNPPVTSGGHRSESVSHNNVVG